MFLLLTTALSFANQTPPPIVGGATTGNFRQVGALVGMNGNYYSFYLNF